MVNKYRFGTPIETGAVMEDVPLQEMQTLCLKQAEGGLEYEMPEDMIVYGLGENTRGINKRGWIYVSNCTDNPHHNEGTQSLYAAHNFLLLSSKDVQLGLFIDTPSKVTFDIGYTSHHLLRITVLENNFDLYVLEGDSAAQIVQKFRRLVGRSYIPPKWAFGYGQSRWSYKTAAEVREVVAKHKENGLPLDSVYLDIDYMERYKDFTIDRTCFADFEQLAEELKKEHVHLVPIIDAGVKVEEGYDVYEEGAANGYFCKDEDGKDFIVGVWPGRCCFPDMLNDDARKWFGSKYKVLLDKGIEGFWNDMNEPAIFYSEKRLNEVFSKIGAFEGQNLDLDKFTELSQMIATLSNHPDDYRSFYHNYRGQQIRHDKVHNLFGYYMTRSASEAFEELSPNKRILMFSRASYIGMHRYAGIWQGDNLSWWSHLLMNIKMMPSLNMCGFLYTGADIGGFGDHATEELVLRWLSFGIFTPLMRNHSAMGTRRQEAYQFERTQLFRDVLSVRYQLMPYLYSEFMKAALRGTMMFQPLGFVYPSDQMARQVEDQLFIGDNLMIAPVYEQNVTGRNVYFPETMKLLRFHGGQVLQETVYEKGWSYIEMPLGDVCVFVRENYLIPLSDGGMYIDDVDYEHLHLYACGDAVKPYEYYMDDGQTKSYSLEEHITILQVS